MMARSSLRLFPIVAVLFTSPDLALAQEPQPPPAMPQQPAPAPVAPAAPQPAPPAAPQPAPPAAPQPAPPAAPQPAAPAAPPPSPYDPSMQAGGLAPPPPMQGTPAAPAPAPSPTTQQLDQAKEEDSERGLEFFYLNVEGGYEHVGLTTFNVDEDNLTAGLIDSSADGGVIGAGAGLRLLFLTLGARARAGFFSDWQLFSAGGELGIHIPLGNLDPHFDLGFGYAGLGSLTSAVSGASDAVSIRGFYARGGGGLDYYVTPSISIGANVSWELLGLTRPGLSLAEAQRIQSDPSADPQKARADLLQAEGTSYGSALAITGVIGLHL
ncbi:MAG: hypothetical protein IT372_12360 [Polyangiaceae bacterium]|nr:hypothetical protein [Polyangiaceae bacterium]